MAFELFATHPNGLVTHVISPTGVSTYRTFQWFVMLVWVCRPEESVLCRSWICHHIAQPLSQYLEIFRCLILEPASALFGLQLGQGRADVWGRPWQIIQNCILARKSIFRESSPEIVLNEPFADNNV